MPINLQNKGLKEFPAFSPGENQIILNNNQIEVIPDNIRTAVNLTNFQIQNNQIKEIPLSLCKLPNLSVLVLGHNQITTLPSEIGDITSLTQLRLQNNGLTELPKEIGKLTNLTHLFLENNKITSLPEEIKNLKKLVHLSLDGNPIPLPDAYAPRQAQNTITYILEQQQEFAIKESLITSKAYYFTNASKKSVQEKFHSILNKFSTDHSIPFIELKSPQDISSDTNIVFIISPLDVHDDDKLIFEIVKTCKELNVRFYIICQKGFIEKDFDSVNLTKGELFERVFLELNEQYPNECNNFSSYEEFDNLIFEGLKQHKPNIRLNKLTLENIGHFSAIEIPLDSELTCLIGENGTGKSTILRALALAIIGPDHKKLDEKALRGLLKIQDFVNDNIVYSDGRIRLDYSIDGDKYFNELKFVAVDNGNDISTTTEGDFHIVYGKYNLKSLIVGFPQARGNDTVNSSEFASNKIKQPHINDLLPLINNSDDFRLRSFSSWISNLYFDSVKTKEKGKDTSKEELLINEAFAIISKITKKDIQFKTVKAVDPPEVWVTTYDSPNGVPLYMVSQGFKIVIGWIGYFLQRFVNTFPLSDPKSAFKENAVLILDEVDTSIHPVWQSTFLDILRETFKNTQFILTTHSPLMIAGLNREQFIELSFEGAEIVALNNQIDTWSYSYQDILKKLFNTSDPKPKKTKEELQLLLKSTNIPSEIESINENIKRLEESESFEENLASYEKVLKEKQDELNDLIKKYTEKTK